MKTLPSKYEKNSYIHYVEWRDEDYAITRLEEPSTGHFVCYEAFKIQKNPTVSIKNNIVEGSETSPSNERWGKYGYTVTTLERAHQKINEIKNRKK
jgi:hypothetical protein